MTEELALEEARGYGAAIDGDEGHGGPGRARVQRPGDELLAVPALAGDEDGGPHRRGALTCRSTVRMVCSPHKCPPRACSSAAGAGSPGSTRSRSRPCAGRRGSPWS